MVVEEHLLTARNARAFTFARRCHVETIPYSHKPFGQFVTFTGRKGVEETVDQYDIWALNTGYVGQYFDQLVITIINSLLSLS